MIGSAFLQVRLLQQNPLSCELRQGERNCDSNLATRGQLASHSDCRRRYMALWLETKDGHEYPIGPIPDVIPCFKCGLCCTFFLIKLSAFDIRVLAQGLGISRQEFTRKYVRKTPIGPVLKQIGDECIFLKHEENDARAHCTAYTYRPEVCRNWVPSLSRPECKEGLRRIDLNTKLILPADIYAEEDALRFADVFKRAPEQP